MITPEDVASNLIEPLAEIYPKPATWKGFAVQVADICPEWVTAADLQTLAKQIITTRDAKTFPNIPTLRMLAKAIPQAAAGTTTSVKARSKKTERIGGRDMSFAFGQEGANAREKAYSDAEERAYRFLRGTEIAAQAIAEQWAVGLVDFALREGREPGYDEEREIIAKVRRNDVDVCDFAEAPDPVPPRKRNKGSEMLRVAGKIGPALRAWRKSMHETAERRLTAAA